MKLTVAALILLVMLASIRAEDDGGFHSLAEHRAVLPEAEYLGMFEFRDADDLFDTRDILKRLASIKHLRLFRSMAAEDQLQDYTPLQAAPPLIEKLGKALPVVDLPESTSRPVLKMAADFQHYGDQTICGFQPGVALLIGEGEPEFILICCFHCHDIEIVRRPTKDHPLPHVSRASMSPELEQALFQLTRASFPEDKALRSFKLTQRKRSKTPLTRQPMTSAKDPFAPDEPAEKPGM